MSIGFLIGLMIILFSAQLSAAAPVFEPKLNNETMAALDYMASNPAKVGGWAYIKSPVIVTKKNVSLGPINVDYSVKVNPNRKLSWNFDDSKFELRSDGAITLTVKGLPIKISSVSYEKNGHFKINIDFGWSSGTAGPVEKLIESRISKIIEDKYKAKAEQAFLMLKKLQSKRSFSDANQVIKSIFAIFDDGENYGQPDLSTVGMSGKVILFFENKKNKALKINQTYEANLKQDDIISIGTDFTRKNKIMTYHSLEMRSSMGVMFKPIDKLDSDLKSAEFTEVTLGEAGWSFEGVTGVEASLTEGVQLASLLLALTGNQGMRSPPDCDPRWADVQKFLKDKLGSELSIMVNRNRAELLAAGVSPKLLNAID